MNQCSCVISYQASVSDLLLYWCFVFGCIWWFQVLPTDSQCCTTDVRENEKSISANLCMHMSVSQLFIYLSHPWETSHLFITTIYQKQHTCPSLLPVRVPHLQYICCCGLFLCSHHDRNFCSHHFLGVACSGRTTKFTVSRLSCNSCKTGFKQT